MWDEQKRSRFEQLGQRQSERVLTEAELAELALLVEELEAAEATYLAPATERLRQERETLETQNRRMQDLALRKEGLVRRLGAGWVSGTFPLGVVAGSAVVAARLRGLSDGRIIAAVGGDQVGGEIL